MYNKAKELADKNGWFLASQFETSIMLISMSGLRHEKFYLTSNQHNWITLSLATELEVQLLG